MCIHSGRHYNPKTSTLMRWDKEEAIESIGIVGKDSSRLLKDFDPYKALETDEVSLSTLIKCSETLDRPFGMLKKKW